MKTKLLLAVTVAGLIMAARSGVAHAATSTNGPHGGYTANTDVCAACHRTHTAPTTNLIAFTPAAGTENDIYRICLYCHDGSQSRYDEKDGAVLSADGNTYASPAGGFVNNVGVEGLTGSGLVRLVPVTSRHDATVTSEIYAPGGSQVTGGGYVLSCASCHDPHGTTNGRQLVTAVTTKDSSGTTVTRTVYSVTDTITNPVGKEQVAWTNIDTFCQACHWDYYQTAAGSGDSNTGAYSSAKRHRIGMAPSGKGYDPAKFLLPLEGGNVSCLTCHRVHGTSAQVGNKWFSGGSTLLRLDERGVCQNCHNRLASTAYPTLVDLDGATAGVQALSPTPLTIVVQFSTYVLPTYGTSNANGATNAANYVVTGGTTNPAIASAALQPDGKSVVLTATANIATGATYTVTVTNVADANANIIPASGAAGNTATFTK